MEKKGLITLLLAYVLTLGFIQAGNQPLRMRELCDRKIAEGECGRIHAKSDCWAVCLSLSVQTAFNAVTEPEFVFPAPEASLQQLMTADRTGLRRNPRPLLPPPKG